MSLEAAVTNAPAQFYAVDALDRDIPDHLKYGRTLLSKDRQIIYDGISAAIRDGQVTYVVPDWVRIGIDDIAGIVHKVWFDHPQYFWFSLTEKGAVGIRYYNKNNGVTSLEFKYCERCFNEREAMMKAINRQADFILRNVTDGMTDTEKLQEIYRYMTQNVEYDYIGAKTMAYSYATGGNDLYSTLVDHIGICDGISRAFMFLAQRAGVLCSLSSGLESPGVGVGHRWNAVYADGNWYHVDATNRLFMFRGQFPKYIYSYRSHAKYIYDNAY